MAHYTLCWRHRRLHAAVGARPSAQRHAGRRTRSAGGARLPRLYMNPDDTLAHEEGIPEGTVAALAQMGRPTSIATGNARKLFERGQIILKCSDGFYSGGSDPLSDGWVFGL
jgi:hypothetical protein